jgi:hypothetical protein
MIAPKAGGLVSPGATQLRKGFPFKRASPPEGFPFTMMGEATAARETHVIASNCPYNSSTESSVRMN